MTFNGIPATIGVDKDTEIHTTVPPGATGGPVVVTTPDGVATGVFAVPLPTISSLTPTTGTVGTTVQIKGTNLLNATVEFNGSLATILSDGAAKIVTIVPSGAVTGPVTVYYPGRNGLEQLPGDVSVGAVSCRHSSAVGDFVSTSKHRLTAQASDYGIRADPWRPIADLDTTQ